MGYTTNFSVRQTSDEGYIMAGSGSIGSTNGGDLYLIKTDVNGNSGCFQGTTNTIVGSPATQVGSTNTIVDSGGTASPTATIVASDGNDSTLCLTTGIHELSINTTISIYPNPATDQLFITGNWKENKALQLTIYNITGERIYAEQINSKQETVSCKPFSAGVYFITVTDKKQQWLGSFVKE